MPEDIPEYPLKWITREVRRYLTDQQYSELMAGLDRVKRVYDLNARLRAAKTNLRDFRRAQLTFPKDSERWRHWGMRIESKMMYIDRVKKELESLQ